jgi:hypothetical protein
MPTASNDVTDAVLELILNSGRTVDKINKECAKRGLPPAFEIGEDGNPQLPGDTNYRFEGFGMVLGLPPKLCFWVHYKPGRPEHVNLGRFSIPIKFGDLANLGQIGDLSPIGA